MYRFPKAPVSLSLPLKPERLNWLLDLLGWSAEELARRLEVSPNKAAHWTQGRSFIPNRVAIWLEVLARTVMANPTPLMWKPDPKIGRERHEQQVELLLDTAYDPPPRRQEEVTSPPG